MPLFAHNNPLPNTVVLLGDSTLDNYVWVDPGETVTDKLREKLPEGYNVVNLATDGFTTVDVMDGAYRDKAVNSPKHTHTLHKPLKRLNEIENVSHLALSVGGNDLREHMQTLIAATPAQRENMLKRILENISENYLLILEHLLKQGHRPIIMTQYTPDITNDVYFIYKLMDILQKEQEVKMNLATKIKYGIKLVNNRYLHNLLPEKSIPNTAVKHLHKIMARVYQPILAFARENRLPVIDLTSSMDYRDTCFYNTQIEPSAQGSELIATLIDHVVQQHDFDSGESLFYSTPDNGETIEAASFTNAPWRPHYNVPATKAKARDTFVTAYEHKLEKDSKKFFGLNSFFVKSKVNVDTDSIDDIIEHAQNKSSRSRKVLRELDWMDTKSKTMLVDFDDGQDETTTATMEVN